jgi:hypothetical protein
MNVKKYEIPKEVLQEVKDELLKEIEAKKQERKRIDLAAESIFGEVRSVYMQDIANKYGINCWGQRGAITMDVNDIFNNICKTALAMVGEKTARSAYINGKGKLATGFAMALCATIIKD